MPTRSPMAKRRAPSPRASTNPTIWWPGMTGRFGGGSSPSTSWRSVWQRPHALISSRTSSGPGIGAGRSTASRGSRSTGPGARRSIARRLLALFEHLAVLEQDVAPGLEHLAPHLEHASLGLGVHLPAHHPHHAHAARAHLPAHHLLVHHVMHHLLHHRAHHHTLAHHAHPGAHLATAHHARPHRRRLARRLPRL